MTETAPLTLDEVSVLWCTRPWPSTPSRSSRTRSTSRGARRAGRRRARTRAARGRGRRDGRAVGRRDRTRPRPASASRTRREAGIRRLRPSPALRVGVAMTVLAWLLHVGGRRDCAASPPGACRGRTCTSSRSRARSIIIDVYLVVLFVSKHDLRFLGTFITGLVARAARRRDAATSTSSVAPLPPALQSVWLVIHVFVASLGDGFFALGFGLSVTQLMQARRERIAGRGEASGRSSRFLGRCPSAEALE